MPDNYLLDPRLVRRSFDSAAKTFDAAAAVHAEIRSRLLERLDVVRIEPKLVVDLGAGTGHASRALQQRYRSAHLIAADLSRPMLLQARRQQRFLRRFERLICDAQHLPLKDSVADLVFSNLMLQWCNDVDAVFAEIRRVLRSGGLLTFTSLGPDSLQELRAAWSRVDPHVHIHRFIDMHDLGDALLRAGFAEPVMDAERLTVTYPALDALLKELRDTGSRNTALGRRPGLTGRSALTTLRSTYEELRSAGSLPATLEVVYGHAWSVDRPKRHEPSGEAWVPVAEIGRRRRRI